MSQFGLNWVHSPAVLAHPFSDGSSVVLETSLHQMAETLGEDGPRYESLLTPARDTWQAVSSNGVPSQLLSHVPAVIRLAGRALAPITRLARSFTRPETRGFLAGLAGHSAMPLEKRSTAGIAIALLAAAHSGGWPFPQGGAQKIADSLAAYFRSLGGKIETDHRVTDLRELLSARAVLLDLTPLQVAGISHGVFPEQYLHVLRNYRYGTGVFKMDWALSAPVPWRAEALRRAATLHLGGTLEEIAVAERAPWMRGASNRPFLIAAQHSLFDPTRAPEGRHTLWAYCHVPFGSKIDMTERMEAQIEHFAPGFRDCILARSALPPRTLEAHNSNLIGGDIMGGAQDLWQIFMRPTLRYWTTPLPQVYLCSASTPPGPGVHGMCGHWAARLALRFTFRIPYPSS